MKLADTMGLSDYNPLNSIVENAPLGHGVAQDFGAEAREGLYKCSECEHWNRNPVSGITKCKKCGNGKFVKAAEGDFGMVGEGNNFGQNRAESYDAHGGDHGCMTCGAESFAACGCEKKHSESYEAQKRSRFGNRYVSRNSKGRFTKNVSVGRSLSADRRRKSSRRPSHSGQGDQGDYEAEGDFGMVGEGNNFGQNRAEGFNAETLNAEGGQFRTGAMYGAGAVVGITGATLALGAIFSLIGRRS